MGTSVPLFMYLTWNAVVLGNVPLASVTGVDFPELFSGSKLLL